VRVKQMKEKTNWLEKERKKVDEEVYKESK
jgi:hypothetical protein